MASLAQVLLCEQAAKSLRTLGFQSHWFTVSVAAYLINLVMGASLVKAPSSKRRCIRPYSLHPCTSSTLPLLAERCGVHYFSATPEQAAKSLRTLGFAVLPGTLDLNAVGMVKEFVDRLCQGVDQSCTGPFWNQHYWCHRGPGRVSLSKCLAGSLHGCFIKLLDNPTVCDSLDKIYADTAPFGNTKWVWTGPTGDAVLPGVETAQQIHSDASGEPGTAWEELWEPSLAVYGTAVDLEVTNGATWILPWPCIGYLADDKNNSHREIYDNLVRPKLVDLLDVKDPLVFNARLVAPAGSIIIRDITTPHAGSPNCSDDVRVITGMLSASRRRVTHGWYGTGRDLPDGHHVELDERWRTAADWLWSDTEAPMTFCYEECTDDFLL